MCVSVNIQIVWVILVRNDIFLRVIGTRLICDVRSGRSGVPVYLDIGTGAHHTGANIQILAPVRVTAVPLYHHCIQLAKLFLRQCSSIVIAIKLASYSL